MANQPHSFSSDTIPPTSSPNTPAPLLSQSMAMANAEPPLPTPPTSTDGGQVEPKPWTHDPSRPYFLPPSSTSPTPLALLSDSLEVVHEYREFVETVGKLEAEYGRALAAAVRRLESKLDSILLPPPGGKKPPETTLVKALRAHLLQTSTVASLHSKRLGTFNDQLIRPLNHLERRVGDSSRKLAHWGKDIHSRWENGRERVDTARAKYHTSVRDHDTAVMRFRTCPTPNGTTKSDSEWIKLERAAAEAEASRADRKRYYLCALEGEGLAGGGGRDLNEGGGDFGWGEEARALYGHIEYTLLELVKHQAYEDKSHNILLSHVYERAERCYDPVSIAADQNAFLDWNVTDRTAVSRTESFGNNDSSDNERLEVSPISSQPSLSPLTPMASIRSPLSAGLERQSSWTLSPSGSMSCLAYVPPASAKNEEPILVTDKRADRIWLVNRWLQNNSQLVELEGADGGSGVLGPKRNEIDRLRELCVQYSQDRGLGDPEEAWDRRIYLQRGIGEDERKAAVARAEKACLEKVLGPQPAPDLPHEFKEKQFATPSTCDACGQSVWAPLKPELACHLCGIAVHTKCALHVDPECTGLKTQRRKSSNILRRSITTRLRRTSLFESPHGAPQEYRPNPTTIEPLREDELQVSPFVTTTSEVDRPAIIDALTSPAATSTVMLARVRGDHHAQDSQQLHVWSGEVVRVLEPDLDGTGWIKVRRGLDVGVEGLVPQALLDVVGKNSPPTADGGSCTFVVAMFDFPPPSHSLAPGEACIRKYQLYELSDEGMEFDENWAELVVPDGTGVQLRGVVPKTYVKQC